MAAILLFLLLERVVARTIALVLALAFVLSQDVLILEYNSLGQTVYENMAMLVVLLVTWTFFALTDDARVAGAAKCGALVGVLALTRAMYSYFSAIPLLFLLARITRTGDAAARRQQIRQLAVFGLCVALTQLVWSAKNFAVYGRFSAATSSWQGMNLAVGLDRFAEEQASGWQPDDPRRQPLVRSILDNRAAYPGWFVTMVEQIGIAHWHSPWQLYVPAEVRQRDEEIQAALGGGNPPENTVAVRTISDQYARAWIDFATTDPAYIAKKFSASYAIFWQPLGNYGAVALGPLQIRPRVRNGLAITETLRSAFEPPCENQYFMRGTPATKTLLPSCFYTMPWLPALMPAAGLLTMHLLVPLLLAAGLVSRRARSLVWNRELLFLLSTYLYVALVANVSEHGENMRFRLSVEPLIWLTSAYAAACAMALVRRTPPDGRMPGSPASIPPA